MNAPRAIAASAAAKFSTDELLVELYRELRRLAARKLAEERPGQTLQATALVHDVYLRLVKRGDQGGWNSRGHFFAAAAEAMRRILVEHARHRSTLKRGGNFCRQQLAMSAIAERAGCDDVLAVDEALDRLADEDALAAELVKLRFFAGLSSREAAGLLEISPRKAVMVWAYARAWLRCELSNPT